MPAKNYASTRFSGLGEIHTGNVTDLRVAWTFSTGVERGHEAAPLVVGSTMYLVTPFPNHLHAIDLADQPGQALWTYSPPVQRAAQGVACCDVVNRGAAYADGRIYFNTLDNQTVAVDAATGEEVWRTRLGDINLGETMTMAPLVVKNRVLVGNSGGEMGVRGWLTALDAATGEIAWRAYSTGPDEEVLIGPAFQPFYPQDQGEDLGVTTWPPDAWRVGGGTVWGWISYDPELDLIYYGTGNPGPWNPDQRPGDNKWTAGVFARDPDTGEARWFYQWTPHDVHDYDGVNENLLLDLPIDGETRRVLVRAERNGYLYVLDRVTGEVLSADPFAHITAALGVDLTTGIYHPDPGKKPVMGKVIRDICPASPGAKDWQPSAYSPRTGLIYLPQNMCVHGRGERGGELHRRHAIRRNERGHEGRAGRAPRRVHRLGPGTTACRVEGARALPGVERRPRHGRRSGLLRQYGGGGQSARRPQRRNAVAVPDRLRCDWPADLVSRARWQAVRCGPLRRRWVGRGRRRR